MTHTEPIPLTKKSIIFHAVIWPCIIAGCLWADDADKEGTAGVLAVAESRNIYEGMLKKNAAAYERSMTSITARYMGDVEKHILIAQRRGDLAAVLHLEKRRAVMRMQFLPVGSDVNGKIYGPMVAKARKQKVDADNAARVAFKTHLQKRIVRYTKDGNVALAKIFNSELVGLDRPEGSSEFDGHYYRVFTQRMGWDAAQRHCKALNGHLAVIETKEENRFVARLIRKKRGCLMSKWQTWAFIGASKRNGAWQTVTGLPLRYTAWLKGQPDNHSGRDIYLQMAPDGHWNDAPAVSTIFVCEWD